MRPICRINYCFTLSVCRLGIHSILCCCVRIVFFIIDHAVELCILCWAETKALRAFLFFFFFWKNKNVETASIGVYTRNDIFHTPPAANTDTIGPHAPICMSFSNHSPFLSVFLIQSLCFPVQHNTSFSTVFPDSRPGSMVTHTYTHPLPHPQHSLQGSIVTQWEGSVTPALLLSATTTPSSSCFPSNHICPSKPSNTRIPYTCRSPPAFGQ